MACTYEFNPDATNEPSPIDDRWECPHDAVAGADYCPFHLPLEKYAQYDLTDAAVADAFRETVAETRGVKEFVGATFGDLSLAYRTVTSTDRYPVDLREATVAGDFDLAMAGIEQPLDLAGATIDRIDWSDARFEERVDATALTVTGETTLVGTTFGDDVTFENSTFESTVNGTEGRFEGDTSLRRVEFAGGVEFRGVEFQGDAHILDDDVCFEHTVFHGPADFTEAEFRYGDFVDATFTREAVFSGATFHGNAEFRAVTFRDDTDFTGVAFEGSANDRNVDVDFSNAVFEADVTFTSGTFQAAAFEGTRFAADVEFTNSDFDSDARFADATFEATTQVRECRFEGDVSFADATFDGATTFDGSTFEGRDILEDDDVTFERASLGDVSFRACGFNYANFRDADFRGSVVFADATFDDDADFAQGTVGGPADFTEVRFRDDTTLAGMQFRDSATFEGAEFQGGANTRDDDLDAVDVVFEADVSFHGAEFRYADFSRLRVEGAADFTEAAFADDATFSDAHFGDDATFDEGRFHDDTAFDGAVFADTASFRGAEFHGGANLLDEDVTFADAEFRADASFERGEFGYFDCRNATFGGEADFVNVTFTDRVHFEGTTFAGRTDFDMAEFADRTSFDDCAFEAHARFDEAEFDSNVSFADCHFHDRGTFRGTALLGSTTILEDDADFRNTVFDAGAAFEKAEFRYANFSDARFRGDTSFDQSLYEVGAAFENATFEDELSFEDAYFDGDVSFDDCTFASVSFFETEFTGESNIHGRGATFRNAAFTGQSSFTAAEFRSADFQGAEVPTRVDFTDAQFHDACEFELRPADDRAVVSMRGATLAGGEIAQPRDGDVFYDLTEASVASVSLTANHSEYALFDYVRFCDTDFDGFDFSAHLDELGKNNWVLHEFALEADADETAADGGEGPASFTPIDDPALLESTYLKAKNSADAFGQRKAAAEFFIKELVFRRQKNWSLAWDRGEGARVRARAGGKWLGNYLLYHSCGYGERLWRVGYISVLVIFLWGALFTLLTRGTSGATDLPSPEVNSLAELLSPDGLIMLGRNVYFSAVTFTTLGYGDIQPVGAAARALASVEAFVGSLLVALVVFVLGRRVAW